MAFLARPRIIEILLVLAGMVATILGALAFEHIGGYVPCALCLLQRNPYYIGIPIMVLALLAEILKLPPIVSRGLLAAGGIAMLVGAGLGVYHSGVEWGFWEGPSACSAPVDSVPTNANDLLGDLNKTHGPSCTVASWRMFGLSFAGWNVVASLVLAAIAVRGVRKAG